MKDIHSFEPIWDNWVIDDIIGSGSYGTVWKAHREDMYSRVRQYAAVKHISIPKEELKADEKSLFGSTEARKLYYDNMLRQLIIEIDAMISLRGKPNIVFYEEHKVVPKGENSGYDLFLRMELLKSLPQYLEEKNLRLTLDEVLRLGIDIANALEILQKQSFVHRDIKPDNIFVDPDGNFKLGDFGTARVLETTENASTKIGTPNYMAPEVFAGAAKYDQTVDIYSLGIILYRYTNRNLLPFMSTHNMNLQDALTARISGQQMEKPFSADEELSRIILKACAFDPRNRYQSAHDLKADLINYRNGLSRAVLVPIICQLENGSVFFTGSKKARPGSSITIHVNEIPDLPHAEASLISPDHVNITIDKNGTLNPPKAVFIWRESGLVLPVSVPVSCIDENGNEVFRTSEVCRFQRRNRIKAPEIHGYAPVSNPVAEVRVLQDRSAYPPKVVFQYRKTPASPSPILPSPAGSTPGMCNIDIICVTEAGEEIIKSSRRCYENKDNLITAPDITGYILLGEGRKRVRVAHDNTSIPDRVVFFYRRKAAEKKQAQIRVVCRDQAGREIQSSTIQEHAGKTAHVSAPEIKGYQLAAGTKNVIPVPVDANGNVSLSEVIFNYVSTRKSLSSKRWLMPSILGSVAVIAGIIVLLSKKPGPQPPVITASPSPTAYISAETASPTNAELPADTSIPQYTISWLDEDGNLIETTTVSAGELPVQADPVKSADDMYTYSFDTWVPAISAATEDTTYKASFKAARIVYTITWQDDSGNVIGTSAVLSGELPTHADPIKAADEANTYSFDKWIPDIGPAKENAVYKASFKTERITYTITWQDDSGNVLGTSTVPAGELPVHAVPTKEADEKYTYSFDKWIPNIIPARENAVYKASYKAARIIYTITWQDDSGIVLGTSAVPAGEFPTHADLEKASDRKYSYVFSGWKPEIEKASGNTVYQAVFEKYEIARSLLGTWHCFYCNATNTYSDNFCTNCGKTTGCYECGESTLAGDKFCINCGIEIGRWKCSNCGALMDKDDLFCENCGTRRHAPGK